MAKLLYILNIFKTYSDSVYNIYNKNSFNYQFASSKAY